MMNGMLNRVLKLVLCTVFAVFFFPISAEAAYNTTWVDEGNYNAPTLNTATNEIRVDTPQELAWVSYTVMSGNTLEDYTIVLDADIDLSGHNWQPIGGWNGSEEDSSRRFTGDFDGQGHVIKNMTIDRPNNSYNGLFGYVSGKYSGTFIRDVEILNCSVNGKTYTAALAGCVTAVSDSAKYEVYFINCGVSGVIEGNGGLTGNESWWMYGYSNFYNCYSRVVAGHAFGHSGNTFYNCWYDANLCENATSNGIPEDNWAITESTLSETDYVVLLNSQFLEYKRDWVKGDDGYPAFGDTSSAWNRNMTVVEPQGQTYYVATPEELAYIAKLVNDGNGLSGYTIKLMNDIDLSGKCWTPIGSSEDFPFRGTFDGNGKAISGLNVLIHPYYDDSGLFGRVVGTLSDVTLVNPLARELENDRCYFGSLAGVATGVAKNCHVVDCDINISYGVGGLIGYLYEGTTVADCSVTGEITSLSAAGGVVGSSWNYCIVNNCSFNGSIEADYMAGGIIGTIGTGVQITRCFANGTIRSADACGGILGGSNIYDASVSIQDCYSTCDVTSSGSSAGGIVGNIGFDKYTCSYQNCYATGNVSGNANVGVLFGGSSTLVHAFENCYWYDGAALAQLGMSVEAIGMAGETDYTTALMLEEMKAQVSFVGFDFDTIWGIDSDKNGGLPYLLWQTNVPVAITPSAIRLSESTLTMNEDSSRWLSVVYSPANAGGGVTWLSSNPAVAMVTTAGQVIAVAPGTATITAMCGTLTASCVVTVNERPENSYSLDEIQLESDSGLSLSVIPQSNFWVSVPFIKNAENDDAVVVVAAYTSAGQYIGMYAMRTTAPVGYEQVFSILLDNTNGKIGEIRAYVWSSLAVPVPLTASVSTNN